MPEPACTRPRVWVYPHSPTGNDVSNAAKRKQNTHCADNVIFHRISEEGPPTGWQKHVLHAQCTHDKIFNWRERGYLPVAEKHEQQKVSDQSQFITLCAVCVWAGLRCVYYNHTHKRDTAQIHAHAHAPTHFRGTAANWQERHMRGPDSESAIKIARYRKSSSEEKSSSHVWSNSRFFPPK